LLSVLRSRLRKAEDDLPDRSASRINAAADRVPLSFSDPRRVPLSAEVSDCHSRRLEGRGRFWQIGFEPCAWAARKPSTLVVNLVSSPAGEKRSSSQTMPNARSSSDRIWRLWRRAGVSVVRGRFRANRRWARLFWAYDVSRRRLAPRHLPRQWCAIAPLSACRLSRYDRAWRVDMARSRNFLMVRTGRRGRRR